MLIVVGLLVGGIYAYRVFFAKPKAVAVTLAAGVAEFNFRVTAIPVPGMVPGLQASVQLDLNVLGQTHGTITADLGKLDTGLALRDQHAKVFAALRRVGSAAVLLGLLATCGDDNHPAGKLANKLKGHAAFF